jgi:hypothetical protein
MHDTPPKRYVQHLAHTVRYTAITAQGKTKHVNATTLGKTTKTDLYLFFMLYALTGAILAIQLQAQNLIFHMDTP